MDSDEVDMNYLGGKARIVKHFAHLITRHAGPGVTYWEPFLGGASVAAEVAQVFERSMLSDSFCDLIDMWKALVAGWEPPTVVSEDDYRRLRSAPPSPLRTFVGFSLSHSGKWWNGYAKPYARTKDRVAGPRAACLRKAAALRTSSITCSDYADIKPLPGDVVYLDPPYEGTTQYRAAKKFDHARFWMEVQRFVENGAFVYVSSIDAPSGWTCQWERSARNEMRSSTGRVERVFTFSSHSGD